MATDSVLYRQAVAADEAFSRELERAFGKRASDMRYKPARWPAGDRRLRASYLRFLRASDRWMRRMREHRGNPLRRRRVHVAVRVPVHTAKWDRCVRKVSSRGAAADPAAVCTAALGERKSIKAAHRRRRGNPRRGRYVSPQYMAARLAERDRARWRIVARRPDGMLLNYTGERLAEGGKAVEFPTRALALKFARYLRRTFPRKLRRVRLLIMPV